MRNMGANLTLTVAGDQLTFSAGEARAVSTIAALNDPAAFIAAILPEITSIETFTMEGVLDARGVLLKLADSGKVAELHKIILIDCGIMNGACQAIGKVAESALTIETKTCSPRVTTTYQFAANKLDTIEVLSVGFHASVAPNQTPISALFENPKTLLAGMGKDVGTAVIKGPVQVIRLDRSFDGKLKNVPGSVVTTHEPKRARTSTNDQLSVTPYGLSVGSYKLELTQLNCAHIFATRLIAGHSYQSVVVSQMEDVAGLLARVSTRSLTMVECRAESTVVISAKIPQVELQNCGGFTFPCARHVDQDVTGRYSTSELFSRAVHAPAGTMFLDTKRGIESSEGLAAAYIYASFQLGRWIIPESDRICFAGRFLALQDLLNEETPPDLSSPDIRAKVFRALLGSEKIDAVAAFIERYPLDLPAEFVREWLGNYDRTRFSKLPRNQAVGLIDDDGCAGYNKIYASKVRALDHFFELLEASSYSITHVEFPLDIGEWLVFQWVRWAKEQRHPITFTQVGLDRVKKENRLLNLAYQALELKGGKLSPLLSEMGKVCIDDYCIYQRTGGRNQRGPLMIHQFLGALQYVGIDLTTANATAKEVTAFLKYVVPQCVGRKTLIAFREGPSIEDQLKLLKKYPDLGLIDSSILTKKMRHLDWIELLKIHFSSTHYFLLSGDVVDRFRRSMKNYDDVRQLAFLCHVPAFAFPDEKRADRLASERGCTLLQVGEYLKYHFNDSEFKLTYTELAAVKGRLSSENYDALMVGGLSEVEAHLAAAKAVKLLMDNELAVLPGVNYCLSKRTFMTLSERAYASKLDR